MSINEKKSWMTNKNLWNYILFQAFWAALVFPNETKSFWGVIMIVGIYLSIHFRFIFSDLKKQFLFLIVVALSGFTMDFIYSYFSIIAFPNNSWSPIPPLWIMGLWLLFAPTLNFSLQWVTQKPALAFTFGALGGPATYYIGERLQLLTFSRPLMISFVVYGLGWGLFMVLVSLSNFNRR